MLLSSTVVVDKQVALGFADVVPNRMVTTKPQGLASERASQLGAWSTVAVLTLQIASFCVGTPEAVACLGAGEGK
jgi:hypothetical protein